MAALIELLNEESVGQAAEETADAKAAKKATEAQKRAACDDAPYSECKNEPKPQ